MPLNGDDGIHGDHDIVSPERTIHNQPQTAHNSHNDGPLLTEFSRNDRYNVQSATKTRSKASFLPNSMQFRANNNQRSKIMDQYDNFKKVE